MMPVMSPESSSLVLSPAISALAALLAKPDPRNLAEAALTIAQIEYPRLDIGDYLQRLDDLAERVWGDVRRHPKPHNLVLSLNRVLFEEEGFVGNPSDDPDPRNCFLNEVLDRKEGTPLTLSIVYLEVGWRLGLPLEGVAFPGHFLVKLPLGENNLVILDPLSQGLPLGEPSLIERLEQALGKRRARRVPLTQALRGAKQWDILARLLNALCDIYAGGEQWGKLLGVLSQLLIIRPALSSAWRDRGALYQHLECSRAALDDFRHYLALEPNADDIEAVTARVQELEQEVKRLN